MFIDNALCVMGNMMTSEAGTITFGEDRFMEWRTKDGSYENTQYAQFDTFFEGIFERERLLDILKNFICYMTDIRYEHEPEMPMAAEDKTSYSTI